MASRKVFEVSVEPKGEPIEFAVRFHFAADPQRPAEEEAFSAIPRESAGAGVTLVTGSINRLNAEGRNVTDIHGIRAFFNVVLVPGDRERFVRLLEDTERVVKLDKLSEILNWLATEYAGRPTTP